MSCPTLYNWEVLTHHKDVPNFFYIQADDGAGHIIRTARIISVEGNIVADKNSNKYQLDCAAPQYIMWCEQHGYHVPTLEEPILVTKSGEPIQ